MLGIKKAVRFIFAEEDDISLENRLFISALSVGILTSVVGSIINLILITSITAVLVPSFLSIILFILYYLVRVKKIIEPLIIPIIPLALVSISVIWVFNGGINGSNIMPGFVILILGLIVYPDKYKKYVILLFIALFSIIYLLQFYRPDLIVNFTSETERWIDSLFTLIYTSYFIYLIIVFVRNQYNFEKHKSEEGEIKYRALVDNAFEGIVIIDFEGKILFANPSLIKTFEYSSLDKIIGKNIFQYIAPESVSLAIEDLTSVAQGKNIDVANYAGITSRGNKIWFESIGKIIEYDGIRADIISVRDITAKRKAEEKLLENENKFKAITETANDAIIVSNDQGLIVFSNPKALKLFGYQESEFIHMPFEMIIPSRLRGTHSKNLVSFVFSKITYFMGKTREFASIRKDGSEFPMEISLSNWETSSGVFVAANIRDITERKQAEEALIKSEHFLQEAQTIANLGIYTLEFSSGKWDSSEILDNIFGIDEKFERSVDGWVSIIHPDWQKKMNDYFTNEVIGSKADFDMEYKIIRQSDMTERWVHGIGRLKFNNNNELVKMVGTIRDITERKQVEQELTQARDRAEESDRLKTAFLSNMSHEIRTPMNGILGFSELLKTPGLSGEQQQEYLQIIKKSGNRMLNIIDDIVNISKIESGLVQISVSKTNINEQTEDIYNLFKPEAEAKGVRFSCKNALDDGRAIIHTDGEKVYAILTNLVKNAIKYTDNGLIEFGYTILKSGQQIAPLLEFYVKDTGIGIPADRQQAIFDRFVQADIADTRAYQGAGLGLSISKAYADMLGGKIYVKSKEGKGSQFFFSIPYVEIETKKAVEEIHIPEATLNVKTQNLKTLIVEDDETSVFLIILALKDYLGQIFQASNGVEAVETCRNNPDIDLVLMDVKIPLMDGYEATRQIRKFNKDLVIIAQTAFAMSEDREVAMDAGCNEFISKPLDIILLKELIQKHFK